MSPLLTRVQAMVRELRNRGASNGQIAEFLRDLIPLLEIAVAATPTPIDDLILMVLKMLFPAPAV